jgi:hypothetical protein
MPKETFVDVESSSSALNLIRAVSAVSAGDFEQCILLGAVGKLTRRVLEISVYIYYSFVNRQPS